MIDHSDNLSLLYQVSTVVAKSSDLEEAVIQVMEEMAKKLGIIQPFLLYSIVTRLKYLLRWVMFDKGTTREREYKIGEV